MKKKLIFIGTFISIVIIFTVSYSITKNVLDRRNSKSIETSSMSKDELIPSTKIILKAVEESTGILIEYKSLLLKDLEKEQWSSDKDVYSSRSNLGNYLKTLGYSLEEDNGEEIIFIKANNQDKDKEYEKGKYYLGVDGSGYVCIYKAVSSTNLTIENPQEDISGRNIAELKEYEITQIKDNLHSFSTREEALEALSEYDS